MSWTILFAGAAGAIGGVCNKRLQRTAALRGAALGAVLSFASEISLDFVVAFVESVWMLVPGSLSGMYFLAMAGSILLIPMLGIQCLLLIVLIKSNWSKNNRKGHAQTEVLTRVTNQPDQDPIQVWWLWLDRLPNWVQVFVAWSLGLETWAAFSAWTARGYGNDRTAYAWPLVGPTWIIATAIVARQSYNESRAKFSFWGAAVCATLCTVLHVLLFVMVALAWGGAAYFAAGGYE
jgi:hypothetical protein